MSHSHRFMSNAQQHKQNNKEQHQFKIQGTKTGGTKEKEMTNLLSADIMMKKERYTTSSHHRAITHLSTEALLLKKNENNVDMQQWWRCGT